jgi:phage protein U
MDVGKIRKINETERETISQKEGRRIPFSLKFSRCENGGLQLLARLLKI